MDNKSIASSILKYSYRIYLHFVITRLQGYISLPAKSLVFKKYNYCSYIIDRAILLYNFLY